MIQGRPPARLRHSWEARCRLVSMMLSGVSPPAAAMVCGVSRSSAYRLLRRYEEGGWDGLRDRPPIAKQHPYRLSLEAEAQIVALRYQTGWGPRSLSAALGRPASTIWRVLKRYDCSRAQSQPRPAANRYEYAAVGELVHLDIKKLGRFWQVGKRVLGDGNRSKGAGWSYAHVAVDDHSRHAIVELRNSERAADCVRFTADVIAAYSQRGTPIQRILTDKWVWLRQPRLRRTARRARHPPHPHPPIPTQNERQSRSLHPHPATRMGLRPHLPNKQPPSSSLARLATLVQQPPTTRRHRRQTTQQPRLTSSGVLQLDVLPQIGCGRG